MVWTKENRKRYYRENKEKFQIGLKIYREKHKEQIKEKNKEYREKNKEIISKKQKEYRIKNLDRLKKQQKEYYNKNKEIKREYERKRFKELRKKQREIILKHYGSKCNCCGENQMEFLTIDHINNNGAEHRKQIGGSNKVYGWLIKNNFPDGFQILCFNCNLAKGIYGICPHKLMKGGENEQ